MKHLLLTALAFLQVIGSHAQNLILNPGFEHHGAIMCTHCYHYRGQYPSVAFHWDNGDWGCTLCDTTYKFPSDELKRGNPCGLGKLSPQEGKVMVEMVYQPGTNGRMDIGAFGASSRLTARTAKPLEVGHLYEVRFWLYIEGNPKTDPDWAKHIGIALLPEKLKFIVFSYSREIPSLRIDSVQYDNWYQVKWQVRPLCTSNYLMIGMFADYGWPKSCSFQDSRYFVDNISLTEVPWASVAVDSSQYFCSRYAPKPELGMVAQIDDKRLLFDNDAYTLTEAHKTSLDSLADFARKYPYLAFEILGHTDSIGSSNQLLSENRVNAAIKYLTEVRQLPEIRFIPIAMGSKRPIAPNNTQAGRKQNRRVEMRQSNMTMPMLFYRRALSAVEADEKAEAFSFLNKWLNTVDQPLKSLLLFDPRFDPLKRSKAWPSMVKKVADSYKKFKQPRYTFLLDSLNLDISTATGAIAMGLNAIAGQGYIPALDAAPFEMDAMAEFRVAQKMEAHFATMRPILEKVGWPKMSEMGESAANSAFFLLWNAGDSSDFQRWLPVLERRCKEGEASWMAYAKLYDKCCVLSGKPQRYVTIVNVLESGHVQIPAWEGDAETVNGYRAKIGLGLLADWVVGVMAGM